MRVLGILLVSCLAWVLAAPMFQAAPPTIKPIQPGGPLTEQFFAGTAATTCTAGFILRDGSGNWYVMTAAHCLAPGITPYLTAAGGFYGQTVVDDDLPSQGGPSTGIDVGLVKVYPSKVGFISPQVRGFGGPTGIASASTLAMGDEVLAMGYFSGYGNGYPVSHPLIQQAQVAYGVFSQWDGPNYRTIQTTINGYSGGPVVAADDGQAIGIVSAQQAHFQTGLPGIDVGPTVPAMLARLANPYGFSGLTLQTAPFTGPSPV